MSKHLFVIGRSIVSLEKQTAIKLLPHRAQRILFWLGTVAARRYEASLKAIWIELHHMWEATVSSALPSACNILIQYVWRRWRS